MKKENICKLFYVISALFLLAFAVGFGIDTYKYYANIYLGSAPLYVYALGRFIEFILPSIIFFVIARICKRKLK